MDNLDFDLETKVVAVSECNLDDRAIRGAIYDAGYEAG
jgi:hypothetical protein